MTYLWLVLRRARRHIALLGVAALLLWWPPGAMVGGAIARTAAPMVPGAMAQSPGTQSIIAQNPAGISAGDRSIAIESEGSTGLGKEFDFDLEQAIEQVERASEQIYQGLDRTKEIIGKTDLRKQAIEHGRNHAQERLESLAEKARAAQQQGYVLSPKEELLLRRYEETASRS